MGAANDSTLTKKKKKKTTEVGNQKSPKTNF